jgi:hypothetical protein
LFYKCVSCVTILSFYTIYFLKFIFTLGALNSLLYCIHYDWNTRWLHDNMYYIGVAPNKKVVRPIFFVGGGHFPYIFFRYMYIHKDKFLCIFSQMKNNAYLPVHLVHAPRFWWSSSYSFTFSFLCVFLSVYVFCSLFLSPFSLLRLCLLTFQPFDFERTWWRLFQKRVVRTKFDVYVLLLSLGRYHWCWTVSPRGYHPPSSQWLGTDIV